MKKTENKGMIKRFVRYYKPHKKLFIIDMACAYLIWCIRLSPKKL